MDVVMRHAMSMKTISARLVEAAAMRASRDLRTVRLQRERFVASTRGVGCQSSPGDRAIPAIPSLTIGWSEPPRAIRIESVLVLRHILRGHAALTGGRSAVVR